jgi:hypothetical protein
MGLKHVVMGCKRGGQHAISNWMALQLPGGVVYHNDCDGRLIGTTTRVYGEGTHVMYGVEDFDFEGWTKVGRAGWQDQFDVKVLVLRDGYNWAASMLKGRERVGRKSQRPIWDPYRRGKKNTRLTLRYMGGRMGHVDTWKQHVRLALHKKLPEGFIEVNYNLWCVDEEYRKHLAGCLGLDFTDVGRKMLAGYGSGSSFDDMKMDGRADEMRVLHRWEELKDNKLWKRVVDKEIRHLTRKYFGYEPDTN